MLWIRNEKTLWKASFRRREITDVIPLLFFATRCNFAFRKCTNHQNHALVSLYPQKCTIVRCNLPPKKMHFRQCCGFICNKCPTYLSPKSSHTSRHICILHYSIKVFVGYWAILHYYPSHRRKKAASRWKTNTCGSFCILKIARKLHRVFYRPPKNPHLRGFQWVFTPFLQVLNEWIFTAFHRSSHRSLFGLMHPIFLTPCISPDRNCTDSCLDSRVKI